MCVLWLLLARVFAEVTLGPGARASGGHFFKTHISSFRRWLKGHVCALAAACEGFCRSDFGPGEPERPGVTSLKPTFPDSEAG